MSLQSLKVDRCSSNNNQKHKETVETYFQNFGEVGHIFCPRFNIRTTLMKVTSLLNIPHLKWPFSIPSLPFEFSKVKEYLMS